MNGYLVWSNQHRAWWRPDSAGYTRHVKSAGRFTREEALDISHKGRDGWRPEDKIPDEIPVAIADLPPAIQAALSPAPSEARS